MSFAHTVFSSQPKAMRGAGRPHAGAEFEVLERLLEDGSLLLVDRADVKWNDVFRPHLAEWPAFYSQVLPASFARCIRKL